MCAGLIPIAGFFPIPSPLLTGEQIAATYVAVGRREPPVDWPELPDLPLGRYTDEAFYRAEIEHVWRRSWLFAGHVSEWAEPRTYVALDLPFGPVVIVRGVDGELRAFLNACRHRGAPVSARREGHLEVPGLPVPRLVLRHHRQARPGARRGASSCSSTSTPRRRGWPSRWTRCPRGTGPRGPAAVHPRRDGLPARRPLHRVRAHSSLDVVRTGLLSTRLDTGDMSKAAGLDTETLRQYADRRLNAEVRDFVIDPTIRSLYGGTIDDLASVELAFLIKNFLGTELMNAERASTSRSRRLPPASTFG